MPCGAPAVEIHFSGVLQVEGDFQFSGDGQKYPASPSGYGRDQRAGRLRDSESTSSLVRLLELRSRLHCSSNCSISG